MVRSLCSSWGWRGSSKVAARRSKKTVTASSKETSCFLMLAVAPARSHSKRIADHPLLPCADLSILALTLRS